MRKVMRLFDLCYKFQMVAREHDFKTAVIHAKATFRIFYNYRSKLIKIKFKKMLGIEDQSVLLESLKAHPKLSIIIPVYDMDPKWLRPCIESVIKQSYPHWDLCICDNGSQTTQTRACLDEFKGSDRRIKIIRTEKNLGISGGTNLAVEISQGEFVCFVDSDDLIHPNALFEVAKAIGENPDIDLLYCDEDKLNEKGEHCDTFFKPDFSVEFLCSSMYVLHMLTIRKELFLKCGMSRDEYTGSQDHDSALQASLYARKVYHIPKVLYHWRKIPGSAAAELGAKDYPKEAGRRAVQAYYQAQNIPVLVQDGLFHGSYRVRPVIKDWPKVSLLILSNDSERQVEGKGAVNLVRNFVKSVCEKSTYPQKEILIIHNENMSNETKEFLSQYPVKLIEFQVGESFNYSKKVNFAVKHATSDYYLILNDDMEVINPDWIEALVEPALLGKVGVVGGKLYYANDLIQHAGVVLGINNNCSHIFHNWPRNRIGYNGYTHVVRNYLAVTGACFFTPKHVFDEIDGYNEDLALDFNDIDYCLRAYEKGYRNIFTPYCELYHYENSTIRRDGQRQNEVDLFRQHWQKYIDHDPFYNPNLPKHSADMVL